MTLLMTALGPLVLWGWYGLVEALTLTDATPGNHITAAFRWALETNPDMTMVGAVGLTVLYTAPFWTVLGHVFHRWGGK
jgi:hypothetical protein